MMNRSASVREATKPMQATPTGMLARTPEANDEVDQHSSGSKRERGPRHTLQAEYVPPQTHTTRVQPISNVTAPVTTAQSRERSTMTTQPLPITSKPLPQEPPRTQADQARPPVAMQKMAPPPRPGRDVPRSVSDSTGAFGQISVPLQQSQYTTRPSTHGSITSTGPTRSDLRLPSRGSYGQPVAPAVATTNVQGRVTQPTKTARGYNISGPIPQHNQQASIGQPMTQAMPTSSSPQPQKGHHRRSSTLSGLGERLFGRTGSVRRKDEERQKPTRKYPPTSMKPMGTDGEAQPRMSVESKRSFSFGLGKKRSTDLESHQEKPSSGPRRFSLLPQSMSFKGLMGGRDQSESNAPPMQEQAWSNSQPPTGQHYSTQPISNHDGQHDDGHSQTYSNFSRPPQAQYRQQSAQQQQQNYDVYGGTGVYSPHEPRTQPQQGVNQHQSQYSNQYPQDYYEQPRPSMQQGRQGRAVLTKPNRKFAEGYDNEPGTHGGSSGPVKKVQDFFRRRGRARADSGYR